MARTTGRSGFKMKSGNSSSFKMMGSSSPLHGGKEDKAKLASMQTVHESITGDMTDQQLRDIAVSQHSGKASKFNVDIKYLKKLRNSRNTEVVAPVTTDTTETVAPVTTKTEEMYHGAGGKVMNPDGSVNVEATRANTAHLNQ